MTELQTQLESEVSTRLEAQTELQRIEFDLKTKTDSESCLREKLELANESRDSLSKNFDCMEKSLRSEIESLQTRLHQAHVERSKSSERSREERLKWQDTVTRLENEINRKDAEMSAMEDSESKKLDDLRMLRKKIQRLEGENATLVGHSNVRQKIKVHQRLKDENVAIKIIVKEKDEEIRTMRAQLRDLKKQLSSLDLNVKQKEIEVQKRREKLYREQRAPLRTRNDAVEKNGVNTAAEKKKKGNLPMGIVPLSTLRRRR